MEHFEYYIVHHKNMTFPIDDSESFYEHLHAWADETLLGQEFVSDKETMFVHESDETHKILFMNLWALSNIKSDAIAEIKEPEFEKWQ